VRRQALAAILLASLAATVAAAPASPAGAAPSIVVKIDGTAKLDKKTKTIVATGVLRCPGGHSPRMTVAIIQRATGAYAQAAYPGRGVRASCSGGDDHWTITFAPRASDPKKKAKPPIPFKRGRAEICALVLTTLRRVGSTGVAQSCMAVKVVAAK
jgi:hypothetical protein